jgi:hypothetical protein
MGNFQSGEIAFAILNGVLVSLVVLWAFVTLYRRAVEKTMRTATPGQGLPLQLTPAADPFMDSGLALPPNGIPAAAARRRLALAYGVGFALSAFALSWPMMKEFIRESPDILGVVRALVIWITNWAPAVILIGFVVTASRSRVFQAFVLVWVFGVVLSTGLPGIARLAGGRALDGNLAMNGYWFSVALVFNVLPPLVLVYLTGRPRIRNVMPLVVALVVLLSLALTLFDHWISDSISDLNDVNPLLRWAVASFGATFGPVLLFLPIGLAVGVLGWWTVSRIGARYESNRFSDMQLIVDAWWSVVIAFHLVTLWNYGAPIALVTCAVAFVLYFFGVRFAIDVLRLGGRSSGPSLLLLRVFGFQQRTERLFDTVAARWRFEGPVAMIAGADLALRSINAGEALAFARGDVASGYVGDAAKLTERLHGLMGASDPDGRYRVAEFFCYDDTWRATLQALVARSSVVLMDLRGFTTANAGCLFELQQLAAAGRLGRCVFVVDDTTDRALASNALDAKSVDALVWVPVRKEETPAMRALWDRLTEAARAR